MKSASNRRTSLWPVYVALLVLIVLGGIFLYELVRLSWNSGGTPANEQTAETYMDIVAPLLENADPQHGAELLQTLGCVACHGGENAGRLAPSHAELWKIAAERRPPLTAAAYIYESIVYPGAYQVEGFPDNMPRVYKRQIPDDDLGDIIAYLLTPVTGE